MAPYTTCSAPCPSPGPWDTSAMASAPGASPMGAVGSATGATSSGTRCAPPPPPLHPPVHVHCGPLLCPVGAAAGETQGRDGGRPAEGSRVTAEGGGVRPEGAEAQSYAAAGLLARGRGTPLWGRSHCRRAEEATQTLPGEGHSQQCALETPLGLLRGGRVEEGEAARTR